MEKIHRSEALSAIHEAASNLHDAGVLNKDTLRHFDERCLTPAGRKRVGQDSSDKTALS